ncbi:serine acetyltransferase [Vicingus serpentipes]|uniref:Serine acetyltransferase n=1 Tax=Vicingus serpentipes TaxID=1926625 RepID=A0A5C6RXX6_9FLAO|nr:serine acetyltransferase [Vicingus serpentipes]TXB66914.1 serine acetyltransferase [Vicingus serpentipes]
MIFRLIVNKIGGYYKLRLKYQKSKFLKKFYFFINKGFEHETNSYLPFNNTIEGPINFIHGTYGVFISGDAKIGSNCTIYHQVTIGSNMLIDSTRLGSPTIGNNCLIGAGAKIIGKVTIGNNCRIGANATVTIDLPDNSICFAGKPIVIQKENLINNIYQKKGDNWGYRKDDKFIIEKDETKLKLLKK